MQYDYVKTVVFRLSAGKLKVLEITYLFIGSIYWKQKPIAVYSNQCAQFVTRPALGFSPLKANLINAAPIRKFFFFFFASGWRGVYKFANIESIFAIIR